MKITEVTKKDFADWVELGALFWHRHPIKKSEKEFKRILASKNETSFLCRDDDGGPVGFVYVAIRTDYVEGSKTSPVGYLEGIYIKKEYRKKGVAKRLFQETKKWFKNNKVSEIGSDAELENIISQKFHKSVGFKKGETLIHFIRKI